MAAAPAAQAGASLAFDTVFSAAHEPAAVHYTATYTARGASHRVEVWRDRDSRIKRVTDAAVTTLAVRKSGDEFRLTVLDHKKRIRTDIDRTNMYRIGSFTDWFDIGHALRHPHGAYTLTAIAPPPGVAAALGPCKWYALTEGPRTTRLCWDTATRLPLLILGSDGAPLWRVTAVDTRPAAPAVFALDDRGYVKIDANRDIAAD